jgi:uncharacterized membrane protein
MKEFIKGVFTDKDGGYSSKRIVLFLLTVVFVFISLVNLFTGKNLDETLKNQLFYLLVYTISVVFGENVTGLFKKPEPPQKTNP